MTMPSQKSVDPKESDATSKLTATEIWLGICIPIIVMLAIAALLESVPSERRMLGDGAFELRENTLAIIAVMAISAFMMLFGLSVIIRKRWRRLVLAGSISILTGVVLGGIMGSRMLVSDVMLFTKRGIAVSSPAWLGGESHAKLDFPQIEWLRRRETISWKPDWHPIRYIVSWTMGTKRGWRRETNSEYLVKVKGAPEAVITLGYRLRNAWEEIDGAARKAGVDVKPVERITLSQPTY